MALKKMPATKSKKVKYVKKPYTLFIDYTKECVGDMYWPMYGKLWKKYNDKFLRQMIERFPVSKRDQSPLNKTRYFMKICEKQATATDMKSINRFKIEGFKV